jgi:hypothetical protein
MGASKCVKSCMFAAALYVFGLKTRTECDSIDNKPVMWYLRLQQWKYWIEYEL